MNFSSCMIKILPIILNTEEKKYYVTTSGMTLLSSRLTLKNLILLKKQQIPLVNLKKISKNTFHQQKKNMPSLQIYS